MAAGPARENTPGGAGAWPLVGTVFATACIAMPAAGLGFAWRSAVPPILACLCLVALSSFYRTARPDARIAATLDGLAQIIAFGACATPLSYAVASMGGPLWDATFSAWDRALGLDWAAYLAFIDAHPRLGFVLTLAYRSLMLQTALAIMLLGLGGRLKALREFVLAFIIAGTATVLISALTPAMANFVYLRLDPTDFPNLQPAAAYVHVSHVLGLRDGTFQSVSLDEVEGIITFPSFHAALGVLFTRAFWAVRSVRVPAVVLNGLLVASTPLDGGHYFVDVGAGMAAAILAIGAARYLAGTRTEAAQCRPALPQSARGPGSAAVARGS